MTLLFSQLEDARRNPARFANAQAHGRAGFNSRNFRTYLLAATARFHRGMSKTEVLDYFEEKCATKLTQLGYWRQRTNNYKKMLSAYCDVFSPDKSQYVESHKKTSLRVGKHALTGEINRFDLRDPTGYKATVIQLAPRVWKDELRWPLIQKAIANDMGCASSEVEIGVFSFDDGNYGSEIYSDHHIAAAESEAENVLTAVETNLSSG
jgi:hypothetical protein